MQEAERSLAAVWSDKGVVEIFDLRQQLEAVHSAAAMATFLEHQQGEATLLFSFSGHMTEGFALDWSPKVSGEKFYKNLWFIHSNNVFICMYSFHNKFPQISYLILPSCRANMVFFCTSTFYLC